MASPIRLVSTDFDGTLFAEFENPPIPRELQMLIARLQAQGVIWVINTGRDMSSLMEVMARAKLEVRPDYLVLVEREIHVHERARYVGLEEWNHRCHAEHAVLFERVTGELPRLTEWIEARYQATLYEDPWSPLCLVAKNNQDAEEIVAFLDTFARTVPHLTVVRNDVYARFSHDAYNKGTALSEIGRRLGIPPENRFAAGDHLNDLPMLQREHAHFLAAPVNAVPAVRELVAQQQGYLSHQPCGKGVARALEFFLEQTGARLAD